MKKRLLTLIRIQVFSMIIFSSVSFGQVLEPIIDSIPMRDGKSLAADIYLPESTKKEAFSCILIQTPYNRKFYRYLGLPMGIGSNIDSSAYAFVIVDWRCFYGSAAACDLDVNRGEDGYDVVEWITQQDWSDGKTGTWGASALGKIQFQTAREQPDGLVCCVPLVAAPQYEYLDYYPGGVKRTEYFEQLDSLGFGIGQFLNNHPVKDTAWWYYNFLTWYPDKIEVPMFMIGGWYDHNINGMFTFFEGLEAESPAGDHKLLFGPWAHGSIGQKDQGELTYPEAESWSDSLARMFFDFHLQGIQNGWDSRPTTTMFQMGENLWSYQDAWPLEDTTHQSWYLHADGKLKTDFPNEQNLYASFTYDPTDPSPTIGGATLHRDLEQGPYNQAPGVESRDDILIFSTETLENPVRITGQPKLLLYVSSDRLDTDFAIRLTDVYPDGRSMLLYSGIRRMRFRDGYYADDTAVMTPGNIYQAEISLPSLANTFMPGHQIKLDLTSSNYPRFDCNLNNGGPMYTAGDTLIANNSVYFSEDYPSKLILPVLDNATSIKEDELINDKAVVYPNPTSDFINIYNIPEGIYLTRHYSSTGQIVGDYEAKSVNGLLTIQLKTQRKGIHFIVINNHNFQKSFKIVLN